MVTSVVTTEMSGQSWREDDSSDGAGRYHVNILATYVETTLPNRRTGGGSGSGRFGTIAYIVNLKGSLCKRKILTLAKPGMRHAFLRGDTTFYSFVVL